MPEFESEVATVKCELPAISEALASKRASWTTDKIDINGSRELIHWAGQTDDQGKRLLSLLAREDGHAEIYKAILRYDNRAALSILVPNGEYMLVSFIMRGRAVIRNGCEFPGVEKPVADDFKRAESILRLLVRSPGYRNALIGITGGIFSPVADENVLRSGKTLPICP